MRDLPREAGCAAPKTLLPVLKLQEAQPVAIKGMTPVGHYAYSIEFSDGHDTGIYTFELLRELGRKVKDSEITKDQRSPRTAVRGLSRVAIPGRPPLATRHS